MGFFGNLLSGKPAFEPPQEDFGTEPSTEQPSSGQFGPKEIPQVYIERIERYDRGKDMYINVHVNNRSSQEIFVDKIELLGKWKELDYRLRPGERREFTDVYRGPRPNNRNYKYCELYYRTLTNDNFKSLHTYYFENWQENDGTFVIKYLKFAPPVKDLWGDK
jgi:hypothetical protein